MLILVAASIAANYYFSQLYVNGDQIYYRYFYEGIAEKGFAEGFLFYRSSLSSIEPVYYTITFGAAKFLEKDIYISLVNSILIILIYLYLNKNSARWWMYLLVFSNFYLMVLCFSAERLKFGAIFVMLYALYPKKWAWVHLVLAVLAHIQLLLLVLIQQFAHFFDNKEKHTHRGVLKIKKSTLASIALAAILTYVLREQLIYKLPFYLQNGSILDTIKPLAFSIVTYFSCKKEDRKSAISAQIPIIFACLILGSERLAMFSFLVMLYFFIKSNRFSSSGFICSAYFSITGMIFLYGIITKGTGFSI